MNGRVVAGAALAVSTLVCCGGVALATSAMSFLSGGGDATPVSATCGTAGTLRIQNLAANGWDQRQTNNAAAIVQAGRDAGVPPRGWVIAAATAMQESRLLNLANPRVPESMTLPHEGVGRDHDSVGLFQQRPSWGTPVELMTPEISAGKFYAKLVSISGWEGLPLTVAAQRVQRSAFPSAYADDEPKAAALVGQITGGADKAATVAGTCAQPDQVTAGGWVQPVASKPGSGFRTAARPNHQGVDLMAAKGTPIKAAAAGTVSRVRCDATHAGTGQPWGCDRDGSPSLTRGCGWYVDVDHAGGFVTRYCHMVSRPLVNVGDKVTAGQEIGAVGSSGHSSGPHLHFEVHTGGDHSSRSAIDPVRFMRDRDAPLGGQSA